MANSLAGVRVGMALTGSFCTFSKLFEALPSLVEAGAELYPILSGAAATTDTRFYRAAEVQEILERICGRRAWTRIEHVEPIGPKRLLDLLIVAPCTGNTCAKLACGIADTSVTMAVKSQLRNERPVLIGLSSNDALSAGARNLGQMMNRKHITFVPMSQDDPTGKPASLVLHCDKLLPAAVAALEGRQLQPVFVVS